MMLLIVTRLRTRTTKTATSFVALTHYSNFQQLVYKQRGPIAEARVHLGIVN